MAVWGRHLTSDVYFQIGLVTLLGLAAKNAILIVEFALNKHEEGLSASASAVEGARLRFRPILMTSLAFIFGVLPLALSTGAGAGARHSVGTGVTGGMLAATFLAIFFVPLFFKVIFDRHVTEKRSTQEIFDELDRAHAAHQTQAAAPPRSGAASARRDRRTRMNRTLVALAVAAFISGCAVVQPAPPKLDLPAGTATPAQEAILQSWWLAFDDPVLTQADRGSVRAELRPALGTRAHRGRALAGIARAIRTRARHQPARGPLPVAHHRRGLATAAGGHVAHQQRFPRRDRDVLRARCVGQIPQRRACVRE